MIFSTGSEGRMSTASSVTETSNPGSGAGAVTTDSIDSTTDGGLTTQEIIIIIASVVGGVLLITTIGLLIFCCVRKVKRKRALEGKYNPAANEEEGGVCVDDMMTAIKPSLPERLI